MKKQKIIIFFLLSFVGEFIAFVLLYKNFRIKSKGPLTWQEIYDDLHVFLLISFLGSIIFTFSYFFNKYEKKGK